MSRVTAIRTEPSSIPVPATTSAATPTRPQGTHVYEPLSGRLAILGGTRQATAAAQAQGWPEVLSLLKSLD